MSLPVRSLRLQKYNTAQLDRMSYVDGEIFYDDESDTLRIMNGQIPGGRKIATQVWTTGALATNLANYATLLYTDTQLAFKAPVDNPTFTGTVRADQFIGTGIGAILSDNPPVAPVAQIGTMWFNTNTGKLYIYYDDGNSLQWVQPMTPSVGGGSSSGGSGSGSGTVLGGTAGRLAYYASSGTAVDDLANVSWANNTLSVTGTVTVSGQKNFMRFHWDTLADLNAEVSPVTWHGMIAHVHDTGRVYFAHAGAWTPLANLSDTSLAGLTDVNVAGVTDGQVLKYSTVQNKWIAASDLQASGGGGVSLNNFSVSTAIASGAGSLAYNNSTGVFTFTPAALGIIAVINGGTGTATPGLVQGTNVTITGTWPNQTISSTGGGTASNSFATLAVAGQNNVVADSATDTLTLVAGSNVTITTNASTDTITINSSGGSTTLAALTDVNISGATDGQVLKYSTAQTRWIAASDLTATGGSGISLTDLSVSVVTASGGGSLGYNNASGVFTFTPAVTGVTSVGGTGTVNGITLTGTVTSSGSLTLGGTLSNVSLSSQITGTLAVANGGTGTATPGLVQGTNVTITGTWPNQTINSTASGGATTFAALTDNAGLTADRFYLPAITQLAVTANGSSAYLFDQYSGNNPTIYAISGTTIAFDLSVGLGSHPFLIRTSGGSNYNTGLTHVTSSGVVTTGSNAQGKTSGTLYWKIPANISGNYQYICQAHGSMVGVITIKDIAVI